MRFHKSFYVLRGHRIKEQHLRLFTSHSQHRPRETDRTRETEERQLNSEHQQVTTSGNKTELTHPSGEYSRLKTAPWVWVFRLTESVAGFIDAYRLVMVRKLSRDGSTYGPRRILRFQIHEKRESHTPEAGVRSPCSDLELLWLWAFPQLLPQACSRFSSSSSSSSSSESSSSGSSRSEARL